MNVIRILALIIFTLLGREGYNQTISGKVADYYNAYKRDSATILIDKYIPIYEKQEKWDSLIMLNRYKTLVYASNKTPLEAVAQSTYTMDLANKYLEDSTRLYQLTLLKHAMTLSRNFNMEEAESNFKKLIEICKLYGDNHGYEPRAYANLGYVYFDQKKYDEALENSRIAYRLMKQNPETALYHYGTVFSTFGGTFDHLAQVDSSYKYKKLHFDLMLQSHPPNHPNIGIGYNDMGIFYLEKNRFDEALNYFKKSEEILYKDYLTTGQGRYLAVPIANIGYIYSLLGEYQLSNEYYEKSLTLGKKDYGDLHIGNFDTYLKLLQNTTINWDLKGYEKYYNSAMELVQKTKPYNENNYYLLEMNKVKWLRQNNRLEEALKLGLKIYDFQSKKEGIFTKRCMVSSNEISALYGQMKNFEKAIDWANRNLMISDSIYAISHPKLIASLNNLMTQYIEKGDTVNPQKIYLDILSRKNNGKGPISPANCIPDDELLRTFELWSNFLQYKLKNNSNSVNNYNDFLIDFSQYYNLHLSIIRSNRSIQEKMKTLYVIFNPAIEYLVDLNPSKSLQLTESLRVFLTKINLQSQLISEKGSFNTHQQRITKLQSELQEKDNEFLFIKLGNALESFQKYKDSLNRFDSYTFQKKYGFNEVKIDELNTVLHKDEVLIEYAIMDSSILIYTLSQGKVKIVRRSKIEVLELLNQHEVVVNNNTKLYELLIPKHIRNIKKYLIVPDGKLYGLSFEGLKDTSDNYLVHTKTIRYAYSGSILYLQKQLSETKTKNNNYVLSLTPGFTESLKSNYIEKNTESEIDSSWLKFIQQPFLLKMAEMFNHIPNSKSLSDSLATEFKYKSNAKGFKILHFGTHGLLNDHSPLFSKLIFAKDDKEDGYLHTYEIYGQNLDADLAVLSACQTGKTEMSDGEGLVSLAHAFTYAGCPSTLMTLWNVDEESTTKIISNFYKYLLKGERKSVALHKAKKEYLENALPQLQSPYYWAGIVFMGDDRPLFQSSNTTYWIFSISLLLLFWGLLALYLKYRNN